MNILASIIVVALLGIVSTAGLPPPGAEVSSVAPLQVMDLPQFTDATSSTGLTDTADSWGTSWGDFNSDGYPDLYIGNHHSEPGLLLNSGDATFTDVITQTALNFRYDRHGVAWGDFYNDGDQDLIVTVGAHGGIGENS